MERQADLDRYLDVILKWWWLMAACVLVAGVSSYLGTTQMPRIYQATTTVMVGQGLQKANPNYQELFMAEQLAQTYGEMAKRRPVLVGAAEALGLRFVPSAGNVSTSLVRGTQLLEIGVRDTDPERARALADEIARQLILQTPTGAADEEKRREFVQQQLEELEGKIQAARDEIEKEREKLEAANSARAIQQYQGNIQALEQKVSAHQATYAALLTHFQGSANYISVVEPATTPGRPISPNVAQTVGLAAAIGLMLALAGAFLIEYLDDTVRSGEDARKLTGLPLVGEVPRIQGSGNGYGDMLIAHRDPVSAASEAYRVLRTNVRFSSVDRPLRTLMVTSPGPTEGKSVTAANLGAVLAQAGAKTLIVDTDLRRPVQHKILGVSNHRGLSDAILDADRAVMDYVQGTEVDNLFVLAAGQLPPNPSELLGSERLGEIVDELLRHMDTVVFDSSPALMVADAAVLGSRVDGVIVVADSGQTRRALAVSGVEKLRQAKANLLGVVLNRAPQARSGYYYMYNYYYYRSDEDDRNGHHGAPHRTRRGWLSRLWRRRRGVRRSHSAVSEGQAPERVPDQQVGSGGR